MTSTKTPRRSAAAPRFAGLVGAFSLHAALYAAAALSFVAAGPLEASGGGRPLVVSWTPPAAAPDDVVALPPTVDAVKAVAPKLEAPIEIAAVADATFDAGPPSADERSIPECGPPQPDCRRAYSALVPPRRRGDGGGSGGASAAIGVGGPNGSGGGGSGGSGVGGGPGVGSTVGDGDGSDAPVAHGRGGATRGPSIVGALAVPAYPAKARSRGWEGRVVLRLAIDEHGRVVAVEVEESSGREALDEAACDAAREWTFAPALRDDAPVAGTLRVPVRFELSD